MMRKHLSFNAKVVRGAGRGRRIGSPTLNLDITQIQDYLEHGIYACFAIWNRQKRKAVLHFGHRPVFKDSISCEVHVLDSGIQRTPSAVTVDIVSRIRDVRNFPSIEELQKEIAKDIRRARAILAGA